jgi:hypothetical protein
MIYFWRKKYIFQYFNFNNLFDDFLFLIKVKRYNLNTYLNYLILITYQSSIYRLISSNHYRSQTRENYGNQ